MNKKLIIFTDLDGTLLDSRYSFQKANSALRLLTKKNIPLILCSSKTKKEIEYYRKKLKNTHPFISENGGGIFVPKKYFKMKIANCKLQIQKDKEYDIIKLGALYYDLRKLLNELLSAGFDVKGFGDMSIQEISILTGLKINEAEMAKERDFDEPFVFDGDDRTLRKLKRDIKSRGFNITTGQFFHIMGNSDKGRAVEILKKLFRRQFNRIITAALGDSPNDINMLKRVDYPFVVKKPGGKYDSEVIRQLGKTKRLIKAKGIGPEGWNHAVVKLLQD